MTRAARLLVLAGVAGSLIAPAAASADPVQWGTPSRNIGCGAYAGELRCDIRQTSVPAPARPRTCEGDYGDAFAMTRRGRAGRICHGDTMLPYGSIPLLRYGTVWRRAGFTCTIAKVGVTCRNAAGHGWFLARERIRLT